MGEIADMILEGILDEETGEYIGDKNLERYGTEAPGFPISYERKRREAKNRCPQCGKRVKYSDMKDHIRAKHGPGG